MTTYATVEDFRQQYVIPCLGELAHEYDTHAIAQQTAVAIIDNGGSFRGYTDNDISEDFWKVVADNQYPEYTQAVAEVFDTPDQCWRIRCSIRRGCQKSALDLLPENDTWITCTVVVNSYPSDSSVVTFLHAWVDLMGYAVTLQLPQSDEGNEVCGLRIRQRLH